jgi:methylisocitrate lyase
LDKVNAEMTNGNSAGQLRQMLAGNDLVVAPGVFNPISALLAQRTGFRALYFSGGAFSASLGIPDVGLFTLSELATAIRQITAVTNLPIIVDVDTGFGSAANVMRTVRELENAGAAAIHLEDQVMWKRCGHLEGKQLIPAEEMAEKIVAAQEARSRGLVVIARTDARGVRGLDEAIERGRAYRLAGADIVFPDALESATEFAAFSERVGPPVMANMTEFGKTPFITTGEFQRLGYQVVIYPVTAFRMMLKAVDETYRELLQQGTQQGLISRMMTRREMYDVLRYDEAQQTIHRIGQRAAETLAGVPSKSGR